MQTRQCRMTCKGLLTYLGVEVIVLHTSFKAQMGTFFSHFMVLYFRNVHLDLPKIFALFWTPVLSRHGEENLTSRKNHLVHLWPTSFIRANYVQPPPNKIFPVHRCISGTFYQCHFQKMVGWVAFKVSFLFIRVKINGCPVVPDNQNYDGATKLC